MSADEPVTLGTVAADFRKGVRTTFEQTADDHGVPVEQLVSELLIALYISHRMWHNARRGDTARTVAWASLVMRGVSGRQLRRQRVLLERQMDTLIDRSIR